jgi:hypothetical protein
MNLDNKVPFAGEGKILTAIKEFGWNPGEVVQPLSYLLGW